MEAAPYLVMAAVHAAVLCGFVVLWRRDRSWFTLVSVVVAAGLTFDNLMLGLGDALGDGDALRVLSRPRFWVHGLMTPLLMIVGLSWARDLGVRWARTRGAWLGVGALTAAVLVYGVWVDVIDLDLEFSDEHGILRYTYVHPTHSLPGPIITVVVLVALGLAIFRAARWPWLLAGAVFMFLASGGGAGTPYVANVGETVLAVTMVLTSREAFRARHTADAPAVKEPQAAG